MLERILELIWDPKRSEAHFGANFFQSEANFFQAEANSGTNFFQSEANLFQVCGQHFWDPPICSKDQQNP